MSGFEVEISQLKDAAKAAGSAETQAKVVNPGTGLDAIATALPGGDAAKNAPKLSSTFNERSTGWADEIGKWSTTIASAAQLYTDNEKEAESAFGP